MIKSDKFTITGEKDKAFDYFRDLNNFMPLITGDYVSGHIKNSKEGIIKIKKTIVTPETNLKVSISKESKENNPYEIVLKSFESTYNIVICVYINDLANGDYQMIITLENSLMEMFLRESTKKFINNILLNFKNK